MSYHRIWSGCEGALVDGHKLDPNHSGLQLVHLAGTVTTRRRPVKRIRVRDVARSGEATLFLWSCIFVEPAVLNSEEIAG